MKKILLFAVSVLLFCHAEAKIWRINNIAGVSADFDTLQEAHDAVSAGDTLYLEGTARHYGDLVCTKKLYIFGPGYFLAENAGSQANIASAKTTDIFLEAGSEGTLITGLEIWGTVLVRASNVIIRRNYIWTGTNNIRIENSASNIIIAQNYLENNYSGVGLSIYGTTSGTPVGSSNIIVQNNYFDNTYSNTYKTIDVQNPSTAIISNNVIYNIVTTYNCAFSNNIFVDGMVTNSGMSNSYQNNLFFNKPANIDTTLNLMNVSMATVFDASQPSRDSRLKLSANSPAKGYGTSGTDCGMFGGIDPYVLSGIPPLPTIYFFSAPASGSQSGGLPVRIKIKSN